MDSFLEFLPDIGLVASLILSAVVIDFTWTILFRGMLSLRTFNIGIFFNIHRDITLVDSEAYLFWILAFAILSLPVIIGSYLCGSIFCLLAGSLNLSDVAVSTLVFFVFMFYFMECNKIIENIEANNSSKEHGWTYATSWEVVDSSLTPAIINTFSVLIGMSIACCQF